MRDAGHALTKVEARKVKLNGTILHNHKEFFISATVFNREALYLN